MKKSDRLDAPVPVSEGVPAPLLATLHVALTERRESLNRRLDTLGDELPSDVVDGSRDLGDPELVRSQYETTRAQLLEVDAALERIDAGTYGRCVECDGRVNLERLEALPATALCLSCTGR
jgi:RNA polymerase-binding transcription factor DksA